MCDVASSGVLGEDRQERKGVYHTEPDEGSGNEKICGCDSLRCE